MKKRLSIIFVVLVMALLFSPNLVFASNGGLNFIESEAIINQDGTVNVKQIWEYDDRGVTSGTEYFINLKVKYGEVIDGLV